MSSIKVIKSVSNVTNGQKVPVLDFVRRHTPLAAAISKAVPGTDRVTRDAKGDRKISAPDAASMINLHRSIARRNREARLTLQMLPDLKLAVEMVVALIMSPNDLISDDPIITSDCSDILPAAIMGPLVQTTTEHYRKNHQLTEFIQRMLKECFAFQGALPVLIIPENALDNLINNYNQNLTLESFKQLYDIERNIPHPLQLLGVPDYLKDQANKNTIESSTLKFGASVSFNLEHFDTQRSMNAHNVAKTTNAGIMLSKLMPSKNDKKPDWIYKENPDGTGREIDADKMIFVTDNIAALEMPVIKQIALESRVSSIVKKNGLSKFHSSLEAMEQKFYEKRKQQFAEENPKPGTPSDMEVESLIFKNRRLAFTPVASLRTNTQLGRNSIGEPLIKEIDTACFIPVTAMGNVKNKLGGYIMLDEDGNPLTTNSYEPAELIDLTTYANGTGNFVSTMVDRANNLLNGQEIRSMSSYALRKFLTKSVGEVVEKDVVDRVKNGQYTNGVQITDNEDFYWLMVTRLLKGQRTQLLWVPQEFLVYFAMDYDDMGFGRSLLSEISNITSMRIMLMVSGIQASLRNSIGRTKVSIKLDEEDPDSEKSIEDIQDEILKSRMNPIPFGVNNIADITKYLQRSCYEFEITGSSAIPDMTVAFEQFNSNYPKPDEELVELLKDLSIHHFGLTKDMIDAANTADFAIQAASANRMTMRRVQSWQRTLQPQVSEYIRKISFASQPQIDKYRELIEQNFEHMQVQKLKAYFNLKDEKLLHDEDFKKLIIEQLVGIYINNLNLEFPDPDSTTLETQKQQFEDQAAFYKDAVDYVINESYFDTSIQGEGLSDHVDMIKNIIVSHFMREWMVKNAILPELFELTLIGEDGQVGLNIMDSLETHIKALGMTTQNFFARFREFSIKQTGLMQNVAEGSTSGETDVGGGGGGGGDDGGGAGDDFDFDMGDNPDEGNTEDQDNPDDNTDEEPAGGEDNADNQDETQ